MAATSPAAPRSRLGIVQIYALVFGIAYVAVAVIEDLLGGMGLKIGGTTILQVTLVQNLIHWVVGIVFVVVTILGFFVEPLTGQLLGFPSGLPLSYNIVHLLTAAAALFAGFAATRAYGRAQ